MRKEEWRIRSVPGARYRGLFVLVLWQTVPLGTYTDDAGRTRIAFGFGAAQWESVSFDCEGRPTGVQSNRHVAGGAQIETWLDPEWRISASAGVVADSHEGSVVQPPAAYTGAVMVAREDRSYAVGLGLARLPQRLHPLDDGANAAGGRILPALHLRLGSRQTHFRLDTLEPSPALGTLGEVRAGIGFAPAVAVRGVSGFGGVALCHVCRNHATESTNTSVFAQFGLPVNRSFDIDVGALIGPGRESMNAAFTLGGRMYLGDAPRAPAGTAAGRP